MSSSPKPAIDPRVRRLADQYGLDASKIPIIDGEPWLTSQQLIRIARDSGDFGSVVENFDQFIPALNQIVHVASVAVKGGQTYSRSGVATIGELLPTPDGGQEEADPHELAAARSLRKALDNAGFDPMSPGSKLGPLAPDEAAARRQALSPDPAGVRLSQLKQIHMLAQGAGLIEAVQGRKDDSKYRAWLMEGYGVNTAAGMNESEMASVINALEQRLA